MPVTATSPFQDSWVSRGISSARELKAMIIRALFSARSRYLAIQ
jgi:hypothetical protein